MVELTAELAPAAGDPGFPAPWRLAQGLAAGLRPLDTEARLVIAAGTLLSLDREDAEALAEATLADLRRGPPPPVFVADEETPLAAQLAAEARLWGAWASPAELEAYAMACLHRLPPARRRAILAAVGRRAQGAGRGA